MLLLAGGTLSFKVCLPYPPKVVAKDEVACLEHMQDASCLSPPGESTSMAMWQNSTQSLMVMWQNSTQLLMLCM